MNELSEFIRHALHVVECLNCNHADWVVGQMTSSRDYAKVFCRRCNDEMVLQVVYACPQCKSSDVHSIGNGGHAVCKGCAAVCMIRDLGTKVVCEQKRPVKPNPLEDWLGAR